MFDPVCALSELFQLPATLISTENATGPVLVAVIPWKFGSDESLSAEYAFHAYRTFSWERSYAKFPAFLPVSFTLIRYPCISLQFAAVTQYVHVTAQYVHNNAVLGIPPPANGNTVIRAY